MYILLALVVAATPFVRTPDKAPLRDIPRGPVWVFFTDKGVFNEADYDVTLSLLGRNTTSDAARRRLNAGVTAPDFDDIPVRDAYIGEVVRLGGRLRSTSNWLNAASFDLTPAAALTVYALPFVYALRPVISENINVPAPFPLGSSTTGRSRKTDTAYAHRFYGPSYDQAQMMGVPDVFFRGHFGAGVRLAIFDTGLKLTNRAVTRMRLWKQHDFLSGDNAFACRSATNWSPTPIANLHSFGLVQSPVVATQDTPTGGDTLRTILAFAADSFSYPYGMPRRGVFAASSRDRGLSWSNAQPVVTTASSNVTFEGLTMATRNSSVYLAYTELTALSSGAASPAVHLGFFGNGTWQATPDYVNPGRHPALAIWNDTLYLAFVRHDTSVVIRRYDIAGPQPNWIIPETQLNAHEALAGSQITAADGTVDVVTTGLRTGRVTQFRSFDGGQSFNPDTEVVASGARDVSLVRDGAHVYLFNKDDSRPPFTRLAVTRSDDNGATWTNAAAVTESTLSLGGYSARFDATAGLSVLYEVAGMMYRSVSSNLGGTWVTQGPLDTAGFCYKPALASTGNSQTAVWFKRGDDNTVWQDSDELKFAREQPDHGTRMASLIAGYQQGGIIGIAPGVDLLIAKTELFKTRSGRFYEYNMEEDTYIEALEWAEAMGADIVSTSLGYRNWYGDDQFDGKTAHVSVAAELAARRGMVIVTAIGNRDTTPTQYPWPKPYITAPGDAEHVITAGGVEKTGIMWRGTGAGPTSDGRIKPDLVALSDTVTVVSPDSEDFLDGSVGTSCATALIAGACALVKEIHPTWTQDSIRAVLFSTATRSTKSCTLGFGVPRVDSIYKLFPADAGHPDVAGDQIGLVFPNPFVTASHARVYFQLNLSQPAPEIIGADSTSPATINIFSTSGTLVRSIPLNTGSLGRPGRYGLKGDVATLDEIRAFWDGLNQSGKPAASGIYSAVLQTTFSRHIARFALVR